MRTLIAVLLTAAATPAAATTRVRPDLGSILDTVTRGGPTFEALPPARDPRWQDADFVVRPVTGRAASSQLTAARLERMDRILDGADPRPGSASAMPDEFARIVSFSVRRLDSHNPPLTGADWDRKLGEMSRRYQVLFPAGRAVSRQAWSDGADMLSASLLSIDGDPYTRFYDQEEYEELQRELRNAGLIGIGINYAPDPAGLMVERAVPGGPAAEAGMVRGDVITHVDDQPLSELSAANAVKLLKGEAGTTVRVRLARGDELTLTRRAVATPNHFSRLIRGTDVGYVFFNGFDQGIAETIVGRRGLGVLPRSGGLIADLLRQGARRIVLDVRGNLGGDVAEVRLLVSEFLRDGSRINYMHGPDGSDTAVTHGDGRFHEDLPLAVLIDGNSASASEVLAASLQEWGRALIVGSQSYGKGSFQTVHSGPDGRAAQINSGRWNTPLDRNIGGRYDPQTGRVIPGSGGVVPDLPVITTPEQRQAIYAGIADQLYGTGRAASVDPALAAAIAATLPATSRAGVASRRP
ncbi:MAG: S41 family peptidase [Elusimicrobiota bacterium]|nr:S41 family peptidase [Elusimicrobiota bacterium]